MKRRRVAVIGAGISGISCAFRLDSQHDITLFEKNDYLGGHTNTFIVPSGPDAGMPLDTGFIVLNNKNYPRFHRFLAELGVLVRESDMSFGFHCEKTGFSYSGANMNGLFAQRRNIGRRSFWKMLSGISLFCREGRFALAGGTRLQGTLGEFVSDINLPAETVNNYLIPMGAAIWSAPGREILAFPSRAFLEFFANHGLLGLKDRPRWQTIASGSHRYVQAFRKRFSGKVRTNAKVQGVMRSAEGAWIRFRDGSVEKFDSVVFACHADEALQLLESPTNSEIELLGAWRYQENRVVLHTDRRVLPPLKRAWASWNYCRENLAPDDSPVSVTYHLNRLQGLKSKQQYCVSLNRLQKISEESVLREIVYTHPGYTKESLRTQAKLDSLQGALSSYFCGSYFGFGFHEDGIVSGERAAVFLRSGWNRNQEMRDRIEAHAAYG